MQRLLCLLLPLAFLGLVHAGDKPGDAVTFTKTETGLEVHVGGKQVAEYVMRDGKILRPYFRHLKTRSGVQVTRNSPPVGGQDADDHATMHPGLWLAFGDLGGSDFWRNKGQVKSLGLVGEAKGGPSRGEFTVRNEYQANGKTLATEECAIVVAVRPTGYRIDWTSTFRAKEEFAFGDQEEMGLGVRVATPLTVTRGGRILDSEGRKNGGQVWGKTAAWCEYSGVIEKQRVGIVLMPDVANFRPSWFHARDYGLLVANPFGRKAFGKGEASRVVVKPGEDLRLRFGVEVYAVPGEQEPDLAGMYREYLKR